MLDEDIELVQHSLETRITKIFDHQRNFLAIFNTVIMNSVTANKKH